MPVTIRHWWLNRKIKEVNKKNEADNKPMNKGRPPWARQEK